MALPNSEKITSQIAMLPDQALKQMAMMHKADPYILPLIISEDGRRKQMRQAAQAQMAAQPQPKIADAALAQMGQLPEDQGIAQIPAPNMQRMADGGIAGYDEGGMAQGGSMFDFAQRSEPVLRMAEGGVLNFSQGGTKKMSGAELFEKALDMEGITDPRERAFLKAIHGQESSGKTSAPTSNRDARGAMQILPSTFKQVADPDMDIGKPLDNMRAGIRYGKKGFDAAGGDPVLAGAYYYGGPGGMQKAAKGVAVSDPENPKAPTTIAYGKSIAQRMTDLLPISAAQAAEVPGAKKPQAAAPADTSLAAQIPGQSYTAPASDYDKTNSFFGRMADKMGIPLEAQRQISTTLNAPTPLASFSGAYAAPKGKSGIVALGEKIGDKLGILQGPAGRMSAAEVAALKNEQAGLRALENSQLAMKEAQSAGATLEEQEYLRKMMEANNAAKIPSAAEKISNASLAREGQDVATAQRLMKTTEQAQAAGRADALADRALPAGTAPASVASETTPFKGVDENELKRMQEANQAPITRDDIVEATKEATPAKDRKGFNNDDLLTLGLSLLASKSPNFLTALGEAGLATVAGKKEREKMEREEAKYKSTEALQAAQARQYGAYADLLERGGKEKKLEFEAEKEIGDRMAKWDKDNKVISIQDPMARLQEEARIRQQIYASLGLKPIMSGQASSASGLSPADTQLVQKYLR